MADCCEWTGTALLRQASFAPQGLRTFENIAALVAFRVAAPQNGTLAWVLSVRDAFEYQSDSALSDDGITIVTPVSNIGRWVRLKLPNEKWARRDSAWHLNADNGDDENDGATEGTALKTHAEFARRVNGLTLVGNPKVVVHTDMPEEFRLEVSLNGLAEGATPGTLTYSGQAVEVLRSGSVTSAIAPNPTTNEPPSLTDNGITDWTPFLGQRIRLLSSDGTRDGAIAWLVAWSGSAASTVRTSPFMHSAGPNDPPTLVTPQGTDQYTVERMPRVTAVDLRVRTLLSTAVCILDSLRLAPAPIGDFPESAIALRGGGSDSRYFIQFCELDAHRVGVDRGTFLGCRHYSTRTEVIYTGDNEILGGTHFSPVHSPILMVEAGARLQLSFHHILERMLAGTQIRGRLTVGGSLLVFDNGSNAFDIYPGGMFDIGGHLWGGGNAAVGIAIQKGGLVTFSTTPTLGLSGSAPQVLVGGTETTYDTPLFNTANGAAYV